MNSLTRPTRVVLDQTSAARRGESYLAYLLLFIALAGDAVRYTVGWYGWAALVAISVTLMAIDFFRHRPTQTLRRVPFLLWVFLGLMLLSALWSNYQLFTLAGFAAQAITTLSALFLVSRFTWQELLRLFSNTLRFILVTSVLLELYAALVVRGPIAPLVTNFIGQPAQTGAADWVQGHLLTGQRIQGILGNANLLGFIALLGCIFFAVEYLIKNTSRWISFGGFGLALMCLFLSRSASIMFAVIAVIASAVVALLAEGRNREDRHRLYRVSWIGAFMAAFYVVQYRDFIFDFIGKAPDASGRGHIWFEVAKLISKRPVQGWGWIGYWLPGAKPLDHLVEVGGVQQYHAHNAYLDITMQLGLIGILLFVPLLVLTFVKLWQLAVRQSSPLYLWPILVFAGILVQNLTESRMLVENGWILICIFMVKVNEPLLPIRESAASDQS